MIRKNLATTVLCLCTWLFDCNSFGESVPLKNQAKEQNKNVVIYRYGSDWNKSGNTVLKNVWQKLSNDLANDFILASHDHAETETEEIKTKNAPTKDWYGFEVRAFPALTLYNAEGQCYAIIEKIPYDITVSEMTTLIENAKKNYDEAEMLIKSATSQAGLGKAEILAKAIKILEKNMPIWLMRKKENFLPLFDEIKKCDPEGKLGYTWSFEFKEWDYSYRVQEFAKEKKYEEGEKYIADFLNNPGYKNLTTRQKQLIEILPFILYKNDAANRSKAIAALKKVYAMDQFSHFGEGAAGYLTIWEEGPIGVGLNWRGTAHCKGGRNNWELKTGVKRAFVIQQRNYEVKFEYEKGEDVIQIEKVILKGEGKVIATSTEPLQEVSVKNKIAKFRLEWHDNITIKDLESLRLEIIYVVPGGRNINGRISVTQVL